MYNDLAKDDVTYFVDERRQSSASRVLFGANNSKAEARREGEAAHRKSLLRACENSNSSAILRRTRMRGTSDKGLIDEPLHPLSIALEV